MNGKNLESSCDLIDITSHQDYLDILNAIRKDTAKIIIVQIDGYIKDDPIVNTAKTMMLLEKQETVSEWIGTIARGRKAVQYTFIKNRDFFSYLATFKAFFIGEEKGRKGYVVTDTGFGYDDIAFLDSRGELLFYTTTHEGYAYLNRKYTFITDKIHNAILNHEEPVCPKCRKGRIVCPQGKIKKPHFFECTNKCGFYMNIDYNDVILE